MRGSVYRRGSVWAVAYDAPRVHGQRRQATKSGFKTQKAATAYLTQRLAEIGRGEYVTADTATVSTYLSEWMLSITRRLKPLSAARYESAVRVHIEPLLGTVKLAALDAETINAFYRALERRGLSPNSQVLVGKVLRRALNDAVKRGRLAKNPAAAADSPRQPRTRVTAWTERELARFLTRAQEDRLWPLWRVAALTGARRGEVLGLTWRGTDLEAGKLSIEQQVIEARGGLALAPPKTERSRRLVSLDAETVAVLRQHRGQKLLEQQFVGRGFEDRDLVFADPLGRPLKPRRLTERFAELRAEAGIPVGSFHVLRHSHATQLLVHRAPLHTVAARLGDRPEQVLQTYAHLLPTSDQQLAELAATVLGR